ncbi:MAG: hypothetical protein FWE79_00355 [Firmicutes bacterium]|nr:hypothetical protein [Bacillota bacterium]
MKRESFTETWGLVLVNLREEGHFTAYSSGGFVWGGEIEAKKITAFTSKIEAEFLNKNKEIIEEALYQATGRSLSFTAIEKVKVKELTKAEVLKEIFGEKVRVKK